MQRHAHLVRRHLFAIRQNICRQTRSEGCHAADTASTDDIQGMAVASAGSHAPSGIAHFQINISRS